MRIAKNAITVTAVYAIHRNVSTIACGMISTHFTSHNQRDVASRSASTRTGYGATACAITYLLSHCLRQLPRPLTHDTHGLVSGVCRRIEHARTAAVDDGDAVRASVRRRFL